MRPREQVSLGQARHLGEFASIRRGAGPLEECLGGPHPGLAERGGIAMGHPLDGID